jgi:large subunit ribosomal protein L14e
MLEIGRVCIKIAGRDAGKIGVVVEVVDENFIILEGEVRRRKINIRHVEPTTRLVEIKKGAEKKTVLTELGIKTEKTKSKPKKENGLRPKKLHKNNKTKESAKASKPKKVTKK